MSKKVYLVTADVYQLLQQWAKESGFILPPQAFFRDMHTRALSILKIALGQEVMVVSLQAESLVDGVADIIREMEKVPVVTMDPLLFNMPAENRPLFAFQSTRLSEHRDGQWRKLDEGPRPYFPPLEKQAASIARSIKDHCDTDRIIVVDDGCYEGDSLKKCVQLLTQAGLQVIGAAVGFHKKKEELLGFTFPFRAFLTYPEADIKDWICERDFFPGVPYGGRTIRTNGEVTAPFEIAAHYLHNFGDVEEWASIPTNKAIAFSDAMIQLSCRIFDEIQKTNDNRPVLASDIKRWPMYKGKPLPRYNDRPFTEHLHQLY